MLFVLQVACAMSARYWSFQDESKRCSKRHCIFSCNVNYLEYGFYTEIIIYNYVKNQTINIKYIFFLFKMDTNKVLMLPAFLMISRYTKP